MQNLWTVSNYHIAYYGAVSAVERAELTLKYKLPGFVWSGWFLGTTWFGPISDYTPDFFSGDQKWFWRTINSRTTSIPASGMGNTDSMLSTSDGKNYNQIWYTYLEIFYLWYDATSDTGSYYTWWSIIAYFSGNNITGVFRLPPKIYSWFWWTDEALLCDTIMGECDPDGDGIYDDIALSWSMEWMYNGNGFKIFPTITVFYYSGMQIDETRDNAIRESIINETGVIDFTNSFTPIANGGDLNQHTVVGSDASIIETGSFSTIFTDTTNFSGLRLSFGVANLFRTFTGAIYPYLEYQFTFPQAIADRYYTIEGHGRVGEYDVQISLKKPTSQGTVGGDFTVIF